MELFECLVSWDDLVLTDAKIIKQIGGKALGLYELKSFGFNVPHWAVITASMFRKVCESDSRLHRLFSQEDVEVREKCKRIYNYLKDITLNNYFQNILAKVWKRISDNGKKPIAVRSSAADEDSKMLSFAGQMDSFLNVVDFQNFLKAVCNCWASLFGERAVLYRIQNGIDPCSSQIAVIVQQMVESEVSGVIFTANPLTGNTKEFVISSTWGLGEGLVSGRLDADIFVINSNGSIIKSEIAEKKQKIVFSREGGTVLVDVDYKKRKIPSLKRKQLKKLYKISQKIQNLKKMPMDIEFAVRRNKIYLLQARPITNLKKYNEFVVWDNSNIVESYSGITTPLTFSFIKRAYFAVYWQFCQTIGVSKRIIVKNKYVLENMLGLVKGRVYYNLLNWYRLISLMPGFKYNKRFMEQMMGLQVIKDYKINQESVGKFERYFIQLPNLLKVAIKMIFAHINLPREIEKFHKNFRKVYSYYSKLDYSKMEPKDLLRIYRELEDKILWKWKAPITNDFEAMIFYGLLKTLTIKWNLDSSGFLQNDLLCGEGGIKSTQVTTQLFNIAREIEKDSNMKSMFLNLSPMEALAKMNNHPAFSKIKEKFDQYLKEYGVRSINEMKLESVPIRDNPAFCIATIQNYLRNVVPDLEEQQKHEREIRKKGENKVKEKLKGKKIFGIIPKIWIYFWVLNNARRAIKNRENQRFCRAEAYDLVRKIVRSIGKRWQESGIIDDVEDIFYLELDEIWSFIEGKPICKDLKKQISLRKEEFKQYESVTLPDHIEVYGEVNCDITCMDELEIQNTDTIRGLGCCAGIVENKVRVVLKPDSRLKLNGEIMVAKQTDPGWIVFFPSISGLIVEKGSMLSHSAIVAREMGIPAVVGVKRATKIFSDGDVVLLNGAEGSIKILKRADKKE